MRFGDSSTGRSVTGPTDVCAAQDALEVRGSATATQQAVEMPVSSTTTAQDGDAITNAFMPY